MSESYDITEAIGAAANVLRSGGRTDLSNALIVRVVLVVANKVRADERQRIADKLAAVPDEVYPVDVFGGPLSTDESRQANELLKAEGLPTFDRIGANAMRHAYRVASRLAREEED
jgi:hypothetical protein